MKKIILRAKIILGDIFDIQLLHFEKNFSKKKNVVEARRFLIFYLREHVQLNYGQMKQHIPAISNHATAIFHYNKMKNNLEIYSDVRQKWDVFYSKLNSDCFDDIQKEFTKLISDRQDLNRQINSIRKIL